MWCDYLIKIYYVMIKDTRVQTCICFQIRYKIEQMEENKGFIVDVKVMMCFPMDGKKYCIPTDDGLHLLKSQEIPVCDQRELVNFKSMFSRSVLF